MIVFPNFLQDSERRDSIPEEDNELQFHHGQGQAREMKPIYEIDKHFTKDAGLETITEAKVLSDGTLAGKKDDCIT